MRRHWFIILVIICMAASCDDGNQQGCSTIATVKDFTGLDGCRYLLELNDGSVLEPVSFSEDISVDLASLEGQAVKISYEEQPAASICMAGTTVKITCLEQPSQDAR